MNGWEGTLAVVGLALITLLTRGFFLFPDRELPIPGWLQQGLRHAPLAALAAVVVPEILTTDGQLLDTLRDARLPATALALAYFVWRQNILGTIVVGTAALLLFRLALGW